MQEKFNGSSFFFLEKELFTSEINHSVEALAERPKKMQIDFHRKRNDFNSY